MSDSLKEVLTMIRASLSKILDRLKEIMPNEVTLLTNDVYLSNTSNSQISASGVCTVHYVDITRNKEIK